MVSLNLIESVSPPVTLKVFEVVLQPPLLPAVVLVTAVHAIDVADPFLYRVNTALSVDDPEAVSTTTPTLSWLTVQAKGTTAMLAEP